MEKYNPHIVEGTAGSQMQPGVVSSIFQVKRDVLVGPGQTVQASDRIPILIPTHRGLSI
jgi:hypothetical protein